MAAPDDKAMQALCRSLVLSQAWRSKVLPYVLERVAVLDRSIANVQLPTELRLDAIGRKEELLGMVKMLYKQAEELHPFEAMRGALYTALVPPPAPTPSPTPEEAEPRRPRRMPGGSVA
jgi:hypothetical protein